MNRFRLLIFSLILPVSGGVLGGEPYEAERAPSFKEVMNGFNDSSADTIRISVLREMGETIGFRSGMVWEAQNLAKELGAHSLQLDRIFQFSTLMTNDSSLPPVIVEANDVAAVSKDQFRTANKSFNIIRQEQFVSVPPTWRDYLYTGLMLSPEITYPGEDARPGSSADTKAWESSLKKGWEQGVEQARQILDENFNRLSRDYNGMMRFNALLRMGMISRTQIASKIYTVSPESNKSSLTIGEKHSEIMKNAEFEVNPKKWQPVITKSVPSATGHDYQYGGR